MIQHVKNGYRLSTDKELEDMCRRIAKDEAEGFLFKMCDKLGGIKMDGSSITSEPSTSTPFVSFLHVKGEGFEFSIENKIITNTSPLGTRFYQYPCTFYNVKVADKANPGTTITRTTLGGR